MRLLDETRTPNTKALQDAQTALTELRNARAALTRMIEERKVQRANARYALDQGGTAQIVSFEAGAVPLESSDLTQLEEVGPSLAWFLDSCGVTTIDELALSAPDDLRARMGIVGHIIDPNALVVAAKAYPRARADKLSQSA